MAWSDTTETQNRLDAALHAYQWAAATGVCDELIHRIHQKGEPYPDAAGFRDARQAGHTRLSGRTAAKLQP